MNMLIASATSLKLLNAKEPFGVSLSLDDDYLMLIIAHMYLYFHFPNILYNIHNLFGDNTLTDEVFRSYFSLMRRSKEKKILD